MPLEQVSVVACKICTLHAPPQAAWLHKTGYHPIAEIESAAPGVEVLRNAKAPRHGGSDPERSVRYPNELAIRIARCPFQAWRRVSFRQVARRRVAQYRRYSERSLGRTERA